MEACPEIVRRHLEVKLQWHQLTWWPAVFAVINNPNSTGHAHALKQ